MATTTIRWDYSGSTYTINYPDGLFQEVCKLSKYINDDDHSYDDCILLIPANGSKIDYINYTLSEHRVRYIYDRSGKCETTTEDYDTPIVLSQETIYPKDESFGWTYKNDMCKVMLPYILHTSIGYTRMDIIEENWKNKKGKSETLYTSSKTLNIYGTPNYFSSNAQFYYCWNKNLDEVANTMTDLEIYCASSYSSKKFVGGVLVMDGKNVIDMGTSSCLTDWQPYKDPYNDQNLWFQSLNINKIPFGDNATSYSVGPFQQTYYDKNPMKTTDCSVYDGFRFHWYPSNDNFHPPKPYSLQGKRIRFIFDELVAISTGMYSYTEAIVLQPGEKVEGDDKPPKPQIKRQIVRNNADPENEPNPIMGLTKTGKKQVFPFPDYDDWRKERYPDAPQFIFTTRKQVKDLDGNIHYSWTQGANLMFNNLFTYNPGSGHYIGDGFEFLVSLSTGDEYGDVPLYDAGLNLYPVFINYPCAYFKLNCSEAADEEDVVGNETCELHKSISKSLKNVYGKYGYLYSNERDWINWSPESKIEQIRNTNCKLKVIFINCHGGKSRKSDSTYALLDVKTPTHKAYGIQYPDIKSLLQNRKFNEYYIIIASSCFGAGLFEDHVHNDVYSQSYTKTIGSNELGTNYFIHFADCANSPAWGYIHGGKKVAELVNYLDESKTYQQGYDEINTIVANVRSKNLKLLCDFMEENYEYMRDVLLVSGGDTGHNWTPDTYAHSINLYENLIILASRGKNDQLIYLTREYPIVFCYLLFHFMNFIQLYKDDNTTYSISIFFQYLFIPTLRAILRLVIDKKNINTYVKLNPMVKTCLYLLLHEFDYTNPKYEMDREFLHGLVNFTYNFYKTQKQMYENAKDAMSVNKVDDEISFMIEDIPGALLQGDDEFKNCRLFTYPGYFDDDGGISEESILRIIYKENPKKDEGES